MESSKIILISKFLRTKIKHYTNEKKLMECLRIQKVNAFKQLVQTRSNAEKTADFIRDDGDSRPLHIQISVKKKKKHNLA